MNLSGTRGIATRRLAAITCLVLAVATTYGAELRPVRGHVPSLISGLSPVGNLDGSKKLDLVIGLAVRDSDALQTLARNASDPKDPQFRRYLTPEQFAARFAPTEQDYQKLIEFAKTSGFEVVMTHANRTLLHVRAPANVVEKAFQIKLASYQHPLLKREFYAPTTEPMIDPGLPVLHISGLDNLGDIQPPRPPRVVVNHRPPAAPAPASVPTPVGLISKDFRGAYASGVTNMGEGQVIGILQLGVGYFPNDIKQYEAATGLPDVPIQNVYLDGYTGPPSTDTTNLGAIESPMDIEMAIAMAPKVAKVVVYGSYGDQYCEEMLDEITRPSHGEPLPAQISTSYAIFYTPNVYQSIMQMAVQGQTFFGYSGDDGAYADSATGKPLPFAPGDYPFVTDVGGTHLTVDANHQWKSETTWYGSGGGPSPWFTIPDWQKNLDTSRNMGWKTMRNCPDVSIAADNVFIVFANGTTGTGSGTSAATPLWAGFAALVNQQAAIEHVPPIGLLNPLLYAIGQSQSYTSCFHDIADGSTNANQTGTGKYTAVAGYDLCTGWGTPNGISLVNALVQPAVASSVPPGIVVQLRHDINYPLVGPGFGPRIFGGDIGCPRGKGFTWSVTPTASNLYPTAYQGVLPPGLIFALKHSINNANDKTITLSGVDPLTGPDQVAGCIKQFGGDQGAPAKGGFYWYETAPSANTDWTAIPWLPRGTVVGLKNTRNQHDKKLLWNGKTFDPASDGDKPDHFAREFGGDVGLPPKEGYWFYEKLDEPPLGGPDLTVSLVNAGNTVTVVVHNIGAEDAPQSLTSIQLNGKAGTNLTTPPIKSGASVSHSVPIQGQLLSFIAEANADRKIIENPFNDYARIDVIP